MSQNVSNQNNTEKEVQSLLNPKIVYVFKRILKKDSCFIGAKYIQ